ncbi:MAG: MarR family winged helix-turn-helix transcriptional regulator [Candidatus Doudnabacteria bacterium]
MKYNREEQVKIFFEEIAKLQRLVFSKKDSFLTKYKLSRPQMVVMYFISEGGSKTIKDIAEIMNISSSAATQMIEGLVRNGFLERVVHPTDRRSVQISMSKIGRKTFDQFKIQHLRQMQNLLVSLSDAEIEVLLKIPAKILKQLENLKVRNN